MGGGGTQKTTSTTAPTNPAVDATTTKLLNNLQGQVDKGSAVYGQTLNPGAGATTQQSWQSLLSGANNPTYNAGVSGAMAELADAAAGNQYGANDAYYKQLSDDTLRDVNAAFTSSGRFGSGSHVGTAVSALGDVNNANIAADRAWQTQAAGGLQGLYAASLAPAGVISGVGAQQDANALALRQAEADLFERQNNAGWNTLGRASSILNGTAGASGQTTTNTSPATPWWQTGLSLAGQFF